jgi:hypothetical protein
LNLIYWGTGNPNPFSPDRASGREPLDRVDRRTECRYRQAGLAPSALAARHADWDNVETPVLIDGTFNGTAAEAAGAGGA